MAHSFSQNYQHIVFAVKYREAVLNPKHNDELQKYITGLVKYRKLYLIAINNVSDHLHLFVDLYRVYSAAKFVQEIKAVSSKFINKKKWYQHRFEWQTGSGAFSVLFYNSKKVINYIKNQQKHHNEKTFTEEYTEILEQLDIPINKETIFEHLK